MKIIFANQLRGIAALLVVASHYLLVYFVQKDTISSTIGNSHVDVNPKFADEIAHFCLTFINPGPVGVAIFFMISGFVISFSIEKLKKRDFLIQRFFRIYPTYWVSLIIGCSAVFFSCKYWGVSFWSVVNIRDYIINASLLHTILNVPMVDFVNWTLAIEVKFYLLCAIVFFFIERPKARLLALLFIQWAIVLLYQLSSSGYVYLKPSVLSAFSESKHMSLMFVGLSLYYYMTMEISFRRLFYMALSYAVGFYFILCIDNKVDVTRVLSINYGIGFFVFIFSFALRGKFIDSKILNSMADISYPFYLIHAVMGYVIIAILYDLGVAYPISMLLAFFACLITSAFVHFYIEKPINKFGKVVASRRLNTK